MNRLLRLAAAAAAVALAVAACSSGDDSPAPAAASVAATTTSAAATTTSAPAGGEGVSSSSARAGTAARAAAVTIQNFAFGDPITVAPGAMITVTNKDGAAHDLVSDDKGMFQTPLLNQDENATFTAPTQPGTYKFSCSVHSSMRSIGTLVVQG